MTSSAPPRSVQPRWIFPFQSRSAARQSSSMRRNHGEAGSNAGRMPGGVAVLPASRREPDRVFAVVPLAADHCGKDSGTEIQPAGWIRVREIRTAFQVLLLNGQNLLGRNREVVHRHVMEPGYASTAPGGASIRTWTIGRRSSPRHHASQFAVRRFQSKRARSVMIRILSFFILYPISSGLSCRHLSSIAAY